jgi:hypothetical protein
LRTFPQWHVAAEIGGTEGLSGLMVLFGAALPICHSRCVSSGCVHVNLLAVRRQRKADVAQIDSH